MRILELLAHPLADRFISGNDVQMDLPIKVHEERVVVLIRFEQNVKGESEADEMGVQVRPLRDCQFRDRLASPIQDDHRLAQQVLIHIDSDRPSRAGLDDCLRPDKTLRWVGHSSIVPGG
jgi:hypothetical protein